jgi:AcrR family transcriptional regulator
MESIQALKVHSMRTAATKPPPRMAGTKPLPPTAAAKPPRRSKADQRAETLEQILDAAEYLFSKRGLYGVTLRDVGQRVGVHTSLLHYYFDDKRALFEAVFARRAGVTSGRRMEALNRYEAEAAGRPTVEGALHAFLDTDFDLYIEGGESWVNYAAFGAQIANTPEGADMLDRHFDPVVLRLIGILKQALPDCPEEDIFWGYHFVTGALMLTLGRTGRIDRLSGGLCQSDDFAAVKARMAKFMAAGFLAICEGQAAKL